MPKFKKVEFVAKNAAGAVDEFSVDVEISADGTFYAHVPEKLRVSFDEDRIDPRRRSRQGFFVTRADTFAELERVIKEESPRRVHADDGEGGERHPLQHRVARLFRPGQERAHLSERGIPWCGVDQRR